MKSLCFATVAVVLAGTSLCEAKEDETNRVLSMGAGKGRTLESIESLPIACSAVRTVEGREVSLLPSDRKFKLVWHDEFDGDKLDESKWSYRTNFWGRRAHWFAAPEDGCVEVADGKLRLKLKKLPNGQFVSPQLQTGELMWDVPHMKDPSGFWPLPKREKPKFVHKYGYYECRCRLQKMPGWWSAFWMQTESQGVTLDAGVSGIEHDIMESFDPGEVIVAAFHLDGYGGDYRSFHIPAAYDEEPKFEGKLNLAVDTDTFHTYGMLWEEDGYSIYVDGRLRGRNATAVSHVPQFVLLTTEAKWYRKNRMTGKGVPELEVAAAAGDDFVIDYVRVYDIVKENDPAGAGTLPDATHDAGGVSFDFAKISAERHPQRYPDVGRNILENPWCGTYTKGENRVIALPHSRGGKYRIAAMTKVRPLDLDTAMRDTAIMIRIGNLNKAGRFVETPRRGEYVWNGFVKRGNSWFVATKAFDVRPGETHALVMFKCDNARIEVKDVVLCEEVPQSCVQSVEPADTPLTIKAEFCNFVDGEFHVSEGQVGELAFSFAKKGKYAHAKGVFTLTLPPGIVFVDSTFAGAGTVKTVRRADGSSVTEFRPNRRFVPGSGAYWWGSQYILVRPERGLGECGDGWLSYRLSDGADKVEAESMKIRFRVVPKIKGAQPVNYGCGGWQLGAYNFDNPASAETLARFHQECGQNMIIPFAATSYPHLGIWRKCGFKYITPQSGTWCRNGYELSSYGEKVPEELKMVPVGEVQPCFESSFMIALCPLAITGDSDYIRNVTLKRLADNVKGVDGMWSNWEPYMFRAKGCGCVRCGKAFARFVGKGWSEISKTWPGCAFEGGTYAEKGVEFRSRLHADVIRRIDKVVRGVTGKDSIGFLPGIHFGQMTSSWRVHHPMPEASPHHYAADIPWINLWGPYVPWRTRFPYLKERARHIAQFVCARDLRDQIAADYPEGKRPRIIAGPQGTCGNYFSQPEAFEMNYDAYFFNRFAGCCPWVFPSGADARYWRAFANSSLRAAKYEDAVFKGTPADGRVKLETVPEYAAPVERVVRFLEKWRKVPQIFTASYDHAGSRIVAVFNCWQLAEAFFTLRLEGLPAGGYNIVSHDGVLWAKDRSGAAWSAEELAKGVFLSVGCCRTRVFEVTPVSARPLTQPTSVMTAGRQRMLYETRRSALATASARDAEEAKDDVSGITRYD